LNKKILRPIEANFQIGKTKSKTHTEIKSCTTNCVKLQFSSGIHRIKVSFLAYISAPYFRNETWPRVSLVNLKHYEFS